MNATGKILKPLSYYSLDSSVIYEKILKPLSYYSLDSSVIYE